MKRPTNTPGAGGTRHSIGLKSVMLITAIVGIAGSALAVSWVGQRDARAALETSLQDVLLGEARALSRSASDALLADFPELTLVPLLTDLLDQRAEVTDVLVVDLDGKVRGTRDPRRLGQAAPSDVLVDSREEIVRRIDGVLHAHCPVWSPNHEVIGQVVMAASLAGIDDMLVTHQQRARMATLILVGLGSLLTYLAITLALRPLGRIRAGIARIGDGDLTTPIEVNDRTELGLLAETVNEMSRELGRAYDERIEQERLHREMELARGIQLSLLPLGRRRFQKLEVYCAYHPAMEVGGDYCDVVEIDDDHFAIVIADVAGKGLGGCLVTAMLSVAMRSLQLDHGSPRRGLIDLARLLAPSLAPGSFVTVFLGIVERSTRHVRFASAAHNPLLLVRSDGTTEWFYTKGVPLGAVPESAYAALLEDEFVALGPDDVLIQTTDGITEAQHREDGSQLGFERIAAQATQVAGESPEVVGRSISELAIGWRGEGGEIDDETLLVLGPHRAEPDPGGSALNPVDVARLREFMKARDHIELRADMKELDRLPEWLAGCEDLGGITSRDRNLIHHGLYEVCANVIEHGYGMDPSRTFDVWRLPTAGATEARSVDDDTVRSGYFMIRDEGRVFDPTRWTATQFSRLESRTRGRGIGHDVMKACMESIIHVMDTPTGNITLLRYDPKKHEDEGILS